MTDSNEQDSVTINTQNPKTQDNKTPKTPTNTPLVPVENKTNDALNARLDTIENGLKVDLEESQAQVKELTDKVNTLSRTNNGQPQDDIVDTKRRSAHIMQLPVIEGAPVIASEITNVLGTPGIEMIAKVKNANGKEFEVPFGCDVKKLDFTLDSVENLYKTSYENLQSEKFELVDIDENDLTGASKVEKGTIVSEGSLVPEMDRSTGTPTATGRKVRTMVRKDVRHYTIKFGGKKFTLTNEDLANIRI